MWEEDKKRETSFFVQPSPPPGLSSRREPPIYLSIDARRSHLQQGTKPEQEIKFYLCASSRSNSHSTPLIIRLTRRMNDSPVQLNRVMKRGTKGLREYRKSHQDSPLRQFADCLVHNPLRPQVHRAPSHSTSHLSCAESHGRHCTTPTTSPLARRRLPSSLFALKAPAPREFLFSFLVLDVCCIYVTTRFSSYRRSTREPLCRSVDAANPVLSRSLLLPPPSPLSSRYRKSE